MDPKIKEYEECVSCTKDWTKCGACPVTMEWVKYLREQYEKVILKREIK